MLSGPAVSWHLLGDGPHKSHCENQAKHIDTIFFENTMPYHDLPERIHKADIILGIFGTTQKASRVIPNKVFQAMASGKPIITRYSKAYPSQIRERSSGLIWVKPGDHQSLANAVASLIKAPDTIIKLGQASRRSFEDYFSEQYLKSDLALILNELNI